MQLFLLLIISFIILVNSYNNHRLRICMKTTSSSIPKSYNEKLKNNANIVALASFSLILNPISTIAAVLSDEERQLQQNQKPDALSAQITYVGKKPDFQKIRLAIDELIKSRPEKGPTLVRLAWHGTLLLLLLIILL